MNHLKNVRAHHTLEVNTAEEVKVNGQFIKGSHQEAHTDTRVAYLNKVHGNWCLKNLYAFARSCLTLLWLPPKSCPIVHRIAAAGQLQHSNGSIYEMLESNWFTHEWHHTKGHTTLFMNSPSSFHLIHNRFDNVYLFPYFSANSAAVHRHVTLSASDKASIRA